MRQPHYFFWANLVLRTPTDAWAVYPARRPELPRPLRGAQGRGGGEARGARLHPRGRLPDPPRRPRLRRRCLRPPRALRPSTPATATASASRPTSPSTAPSSSAAAHCAPRSTSPSASIRPPRPARSAACSTAPLPPGARFAARLGVEEPRGIGAGQLAALRQAEEAAFERVLGYLECSPGRPAAPRGADPPRLHPRPRRARRRRGLRAAGAHLPRPRAASSASSPTAMTSCACTRAGSPSAAAR